MLLRTHKVDIKIGNAPNISLLLPLEKIATLKMTKPAATKENSSH